MTNEASRAHLIWTIVRKDFRYLRRQGGWTILGLSLVLFVLMMVFHVRMLREMTGFPGFEWASYELAEQASRVTEAPQGMGHFRLSGLDVVYGLAVFTNLLLTAVAFATAYGSEIRRGTVRTLVCYPVGFLEITVAKLIHAGILGFGTSLAVLVVPWLTLKASPVVPFACLVVASCTTVLALATGALLAGALARVRKRMVVKPTTLGVVVAAASFVFTERLLDLLLRIVFSSAAPLQMLFPGVMLSPYHGAGGLLAWALGGGPPVHSVLLLVPIVLVAVGLRASSRVLPDCYERE